MILSLLVLTLLIGAILKLPFLNTPLDRDYGIYGYYALFWCHNGKIPYIDIPENHPPGRWLLYKALLKYCKVSRHTFRISNVIFLLVTQVIVFLIAKHAFGATAGLISSLLFAMLSSLPAFFWVQSSDEIGQILFNTLAIAGILVFPMDNYFAYYLIGLSTFMALFFKQSAYINTFPVVGVLLFLQKTPLINYVSVSLGILTGFFFTGILFKMYKIPMHRYKFIFALDAYAFKVHLDNIFFFKKVAKPVKMHKDEALSAVNNREHRSSEAARSEKLPWVSHPWVKKLLKEWFLQTNLFLFFCLAGLFISFNLSGNVRIQYVLNHSCFKLYLWLGVGIVTVILNQHLMPYHFVPLMPPIAILSAVGMAGSFSWLHDNTGIWYGILVFLGVFGGSLFLMKNEIRGWLAREKKGRGRIYTHGGDWELNSVGELIGKYVNTKANPGDQIYVWGHEYEIYLWAQRSSPTDTLFCPCPEISFSTDPLGEESRILQRLEVTPPKYIIVCADTEGFQRFESLLQQHYFLERKVFGEIGLYRSTVDPVPEKDARPVEKGRGERTFIPPQRKDNLVSIIILTCNALEYTKMCVNSIQNHTTYPHEIIFVDNASTDGTIEYLQKLVEQNRNYKLLRNSENKGFAVGNNQGVAAAGGEYVMLLNNDVLVSDGWLESLVKSLEQDAHIGMVGPITNYISGRQAIKGVPYRDEYGFAAFAKKVRDHNWDKVTPRRRVAGFAVLMRKSVYEEVGGLDETFGVGNFEDDDLCIKVSRRGYAIMVDESTFIHHFGNQTFKANKIDYNQNLNERLAIFKRKWPGVDYEELLELKESLVNVNTSLLSRGKQALDLGNKDEAQKCFSHILRTNPVDAGALSGLCFAYLMKGDTDMAFKTFAKMMEIASIPDVKGTLTKLCKKAEDFLRNKRYHEAIDVYNKVLNIHFHHRPMEEDGFSLLDIYHNLALAYTSVDELDNAISVLKTALEFNWSDASVYNNLGVFYFKKNMHKDAKTYFEKALSIDADYEEARQNLEKIS